MRLIYIIINTNLQPDTVGARLVLAARDKPPVALTIIAEEQ